MRWRTGHSIGFGLFFVLAGFFSLHSCDNDVSSPDLTFQVVPDSVFIQVWAVQGRCDIKRRFGDTIYYTFVGPSDGCWATIDSIIGDKPPPDTMPPPPDTMPPPPPPPPPPSGIVELHDGDVWSGTAQQVCISRGSCGVTVPADNVTVHDFSINGTGLAPWRITNNGLLFVQGPTRGEGSSDILIERGEIQNCPPGEGGLNDYEHHAAFTVKIAERNGVTMRDVDLHGCLSAFYFKGRGPGPILLDGVRAWDMWGFAMRSDNIMFQNAVLDRIVHQRYFGANLTIEQSTFIDPGFEWQEYAGGGLVRNNVFLNVTVADMPPGAIVEGNCWLTGSRYEHFADPDRRDYTLIGQAAQACAGKGAPPR